MSDLLAAVGQVFTSAMTMVAGVVTFKNPVLLLFCVAVPLCGLGVGMFARLLRSRG